MCSIALYRTSSLQIESKAGVDLQSAKETGSRKTQLVKMLSTTLYQPMEVIEMYAELFNE